MTNFYTVNPFGTSFWSVIRKFIACILLLGTGLTTYAQVPDANGIVYIKSNGTGDGSSWANASSDLHNAIHAAGVTKVYVAIGNYNVDGNSFVMKNGVEIYGGFDPVNNTTDWNTRILPNEYPTNGGSPEGSVLNGQNSKPVIWNEFTSSTALDNSAVLDGFTVKNARNTVTGVGAGIFNKFASPVLRNLVIKNNYTVIGAGINNSASSPLVTNVKIINNFGSDGVAFIELDNSNSILTNVEITKNVANATNGNIVIHGGGTIMMKNVTIVDNTATNATLLGGGTLIIDNSIILGYIDGNGNFVKKHSLVTGNTDFSNGNLNASGVTLNDLFTDPFNLDYTLKYGAMVINKGNNALYPGLNASTEDLAGNPRVYNYAYSGVIDMGAYESPYNSPMAHTAGIIYVTPNGTGDGSGKDWSNSTSDLHNAIHLSGVQKVFVAKGNYNVGDNSYVMKNNVSIYGGFDPTNGIDSLDDNRILPNKGMGDGSVLNGQNVRPLIWNDGNGLNHTAILDGFTLTNGYTSNNGGAILNSNSAPAFNNLVIKNNAAGTSGGGIYNQNASILLSNTIITNNTALYGGGVRNNNSTSEFTNVVIKNNAATMNTGESGGGGIFNEGSNLKLTNVLIADNSTNRWGGGFRNISGVPELLNVTIANNTAVNQSATTAMDLKTGYIPQIKNTVIFGTVTGDYTANYSMIQGNANFNNGNIASTSLTEVFTNPSSGNYTLKYGSTAVNAGSNALFPGLTADTKDVAGNVRVYNYDLGGIIDMGAYESTYTPITPTNGIVYVTPNGTGDGSSWADATSDLHSAMLAVGASKVFVAIGNYNVGVNSFIMKNGVEIYGGFDPANGIEDLDDNRIMPNPTNTQGAVLNGENTRPVIWNVFTSGTAMDNTAVLDGFTIYNGKNASGAGIRNVYASPTLRNLVIRGNNATSSGAGIYNENSNPDIYNTVISDNIVTGAFGQSSLGAGIYNITNSAPTIVNTTIANNQLTGLGSNPVLVGAGVATLYGAAPKIYNSIIWNNQKSGVANIAGADIETIGASVTLNNSITQLYDTGNPADNNLVGIDPMFISANDFNLKGGSPAINSGNNAYFTFGGGLDLAGNPRIFGWIIDMGAYEYRIIPDANDIVYVRQTAQGNGSGTSWNDATDDLHNAIHTIGVQKVFVAIGNYNVGTTSFIMKNNVAIYGGFDPENGIEDLDDERILPTEAVEGSVLNGQNVRAIIYNDNNGLTATAVLDGFTLKNGNGNNGGAIYNFNASPDFNNLVVKNNTAITSGGAIYNLNAPIKLSNSIITNNTALYGGGVRNNSSNSEFTNVIIKNNSATLATGGAGGGGIFNELSNLKLTDVLIAENSTQRWGGGLRNLSGNPVFTNVTIANNTAENQPATAALELISGGNPQINNSIIYGTITGTYTAHYSLIEGNTDTTNNNINTIGITKEDVFTNPTASDYTLKAGSPAVDAGSNTLFIGLDGNTKDLAGNPRVFNFGTGIIDMGAYESPFEPLTPDVNGIIYVKTIATGTGSGKDWDNATSELHNAIHTNGVTKVFVAVGNYPVGSSSFVMKNNVEIYGGFDPDNGIEDLSDERILPNHGVSEGSVLDGQNTRPLIWNDFTSATALNNSAVLDGFTVKNGNLNSGYGGGIHNVYASPILRNLLVKTNRSLWGGGISAQSASSPIITDVILYDNFSYGAGGGGAGAMYSDDGAPVLTNVSIIANRANLDVGGYMCRGGNPVFNNVTIVGNQKEGFWASNGGNISLNNSIVLNNVYTSGGAYSPKYSLIEGNTDFTNGNINPSGITVTDIFTDPVNGNYTLKDGSAAVNAGSNALFPNLDANTKDLAGNTRVYNFANGGIIDMGAYESSFVTIIPDANNTLYVDINVAGGNSSGDSWANAIPQLADAMKYARGQFIADNTVYDATPLKIYVAKGTYKPLYSARDGHYTENETRDNAFVMVKNVQLYGGFDPDNGIDDLTDTRIFDDNGSILSGDIYNNQLNNARHVVVASNAVGNAVLDGFTIQDAYSNASSIIYINGYPVYGHHGAMACWGSSPTIANCTFKYNSVFGLGGGIYNIQSSPTITNCSFRGNSAYNGGGIYNSQSSPVITDCSFTLNGSENGGAIYNSNNSSPVISNCSFKNNSGIADGGAIYNDASSPIITNALFTNNSAAGGIIPNGASGNGGAIYNTGASSPSLTNVTIANNTGANTLYSTGSGSTSINNSIVYGTISATYTQQFSLINGDYNETGTNYSVNNTFNDPTNGDYTLKNGSAAVNAGSNALFPNLDANTKDLAGNTRVYNFANGGIIDMGAYESSFVTIIPDANNTLYVDINVTGGNGSGDSWANAIPQLADAMKYARQQYDANNTIYDATPLKIYVAKGTYKPMYSPRNNYYTVDEGRDNAFTMVKNVQVYGGFDPANGIDDISDTRIFGTGGSILSGDIGITAPEGNYLYDNTYHIVVSSNAVGSALLDGFTITDAYSESTSVFITVNTYPVYRAFGAIYCVRSSPSFANCIITANFIYTGGGMYNYQQSSPTLTNCSFLSNGSKSDGGAIYNNTNSSPVITNCSFLSNAAVSNGGAIYNSTNSSPIITNCSFTENSAHTADGGAIYNSASSPVIINSLLANNNAGDNLATGNGGAIYNTGTSSPTLTNVTIAGNTAHPNNAIYATAGSTTINNSIVFGGISATYTQQFSLINGDYNATGTNYSLTNTFNDPTNGDYTLKNTSVAINAGSNALFPNLDANTLDLAGNARVYDFANGGNIDLGAYEYQGTPLPIQLLSFTEQKQNTTALLRWATANEQNNHGFEIQRSTDGKYWTPLTFIYSKADGGNSLSPLQYSYSDDQPAKAVNYYRLKQIDRNGSYEYSIIRSVSFDGGRAINVYPNPATVQVTVTGLQKEDQITLVDGLGNKVRQYVSNDEKMTVPMDQLQHGIYYIVVTNAGRPVTTFKVVKGE